MSAFPAAAIASLPTIVVNNALRNVTCANSRLRAGFAHSSQQLQAIVMSAQLFSQPRQVAPLSSIPASLLSLICQHLPLRSLLVLSTVDRRTRGVLCPERRRSGFPVSLAVSADCWRYASTARVEWAVKWNRSAGQWGPATLELNESVLHSATASIHAALAEAFTAGASAWQQPQPTIAEAFAGIHLSTPVFDISRYTPPASQPPSVPYPLIPPLTAMLRSLRFVRRLELSMALVDSNLRVLLTILTALPTFPLLHSLTLRHGRNCTTQMSLHAMNAGSEAADAVVNGLFGCLVSLPRLSSLELIDEPPTRRRLPVHFSNLIESQFALDALHATMERLLHAHLDSTLLAGMVRQQAQAAWASRYVEVQRCKEQQSAAAAFGHAHSAPDTAHTLELASLQSLELTGSSAIEGGLLRVFPSLVLLDA